MKIIWFFNVVILTQFDLIASQLPNVFGPVDHSIHLISSETKTLENERSFKYDQNDGQKREEIVSIVNAGSEDEFVSFKGFYEYFASDGRKYRVDYVADKNGYKPVIHVAEVAIVNFISPALAKSLVG